MSSINSISPDRVARLIGTPRRPALIDVRPDEEFAADPGLVPGSMRRNRQGRTLWVTRERPKIDRIACPWLIRRFVDPAALFMFVAPAEVTAVAEQFQAAPFDIEGVFWSHRGEVCTFDVLIDELGLASPPLVRLAAIVRG